MKQTIFVVSKDQAVSDLKEIILGVFKEHLEKYISGQTKVDHFRAIHNLETSWSPQRIAKNWGRFCQKRQREIFAKNKTVDKIYLSYPREPGESIVEDLFFITARAL